MFQGQIEEIPFLSQGKLGFFLILALFKDEPIPHKNFMFLSQGSYVIPGGRAYLPLWYPM